MTRQLMEMLIDSRTGEIISAEPTPRTIIKSLKKIEDPVEVWLSHPCLTASQIREEVGQYAPRDANAFFRGIPPCDSYKDGDEERRGDGGRLIIQFYNTKTR